MSTILAENSRLHSSAWGLLALAIVGEIIGAIGLRFSQGFTVLLPTVIALVAFSVALFLISRIMKHLPVSIAYPIWAGGGTAGVALIGIVVLAEPLTSLKTIGIGLIMVGVVLVNVVSEKRSGC